MIHAMKVRKIFFFGQQTAYLVEVPERFVGGIIITEML